MTRAEAVKEFIDKVKLAYIEDQKAKNIRASGRSAESLRDDVTPNFGRLYGVAYFEFQRRGRRPGGFPPIDAILQWIKDKGIQADIPDKSLAFLIARKIAKKGTDIFLGKRPALTIEAEKMEEYRKELVKNLIQAGRDELLKSIKKVQHA